MTTSPEHDAVTATLATLAGLVGCASVLTFFDDRRPDVLRCDPSRGLLFIGEAKHAEGPRDAASVARLRTYLLWLSAHLRTGRPALLAFAVTKADELSGWRAILTAAIARVDLPVPNVRSEQIDADTSLLLFAWTPLFRGMARSNRRHRERR